MKNGRVTLTLSAASLLLATALSAAPPPQDDSGYIASPLLSPEPPAWEDRSVDKAAVGEGFAAVEVRRIASDLSKDAPVEQVELALHELMPQIYRATNKDMAVVSEALASLRQQPGTIAALASHYQQLSKGDYQKRLVLVDILGGLQRADAAAPLHDIVWEPLPPGEWTPESLSDRDVEEMIQAKAIHGLAFLRTELANEAVRDVIVNHESLHVRASAIDAYMWNQGDSRETADELYALLPEEMHMYVERPRFRNGMDIEEFNRRVDVWREKYAVDPEPIPELDAGHVGHSH